MRCPDCGGKKYRRNMLDREFQELERQWMQGDFEAGARILRERMRMYGHPFYISEDYVRRAAALGDARAEALGLEPWRSQRFPRAHIPRPVPLRAVLDGLPENLIVSFAADVAERVIPELHSIVGRYPEFLRGDDAPPLGAPARRLRERLERTIDEHSARIREAIEAARRWVEDPSQVTANRAWLAAEDIRLSSYNRPLDTLDFQIVVHHVPHLLAMSRSAQEAALAAVIADRVRERPPVNTGNNFVARRNYQIMVLEHAVTAAANVGLVLKAEEAQVYEAEEAWRRQRLIQYLLGEVQL